jgi:hypothetical protein
MSLGYFLHNSLMIKNLYLPGFSHRLCGRRAGQQLKTVRTGAERLNGLAALVSKFVPAAVFGLAQEQRERIYTPWVTFVAFLGQVLTRASSCREAVRKVQAWCLADSKPPPDDNTSGYCQARTRLALTQLRTAHEKVSEWIGQRVSQTYEWCGRTVKVMDGCGFSMPDTASNRARWPYAGGQKPGCGFPTAQMVGLFCLATGRLVRFAIDSWKAHEIPLARLLVGWMQPGEIVLTDRGFCGWGLIALLQRKGVDVVMRLHQHRCGSGRRQRWKRPQRPQSWSRALWGELPPELVVRLVHVRIRIRGFRTETVTLATTLLEEAIYTDESLAQLYARRWKVELCFRDIKTTLGMDVLRCLSPELVEKELWMHAIAYNLIRALMLEAALTHGVDLERLSFKGTVDTLRQWEPLLDPARARHRTARRELLRILASDRVPLRPHRSEPRARKRRPKNYQFLTRPRRQMCVSPSRAKK